MIHNTLQILRKWRLDTGWTIKKSTVNQNHIITDKYETIPKEYLFFIETFSTFAKGNEMGWFLSNSDFNEDDSNSFKWNDFYKMSLEWSDESDYASIHSFGNNHIPIYMGVNPF